MSFDDPIAYAKKLQRYMARNETAPWSAEGSRLLGLLLAQLEAPNPPSWGELATEVAAYRAQWGSDSGPLEVVMLIESCIARARE